LRHTCFARFEDQQSSPRLSLQELSPCLQCTANKKLWPHSVLVRLLQYFSIPAVAQYHCLHVLTNHARGDKNSGCKNCPKIGPSGTSTRSNPRSQWSGWCKPHLVLSVCRSLQSGLRCLYPAASLFTDSVALSANGYTHVYKCHQGDYTTFRLLPCNTRYQLVEFGDILACEALHQRAACLRLSRAEIRL